MDHWGYYPPQLVGVIYNSTLWLAHLVFANGLETVRV